MLGRIVLVSVVVLAFFSAATTERTGLARDPCWLQVELKNAAPITTFEIYWSKPAKTYRYTLEGSVDGNTWTKLGDHTTAVPTSVDSQSELSRLNLPGATYRFLRVNVFESRNVSIVELKAYSQLLPTTKNELTRQMVYSNYPFQSNRLESARLAGLNEAAIAF